MITVSLWVCFAPCSDPHDFGSRAKGSKYFKKANNNLTGHTGLFSRPGLGGLGPKEHQNFSERQKDRDTEVTGKKGRVTEREAEKATKRETKGNQAGRRKAEVREIRERETKRLTDRVTERPGVTETEEEKDEGREAEKKAGKGQGKGSERKKRRALERTGRARKGREKWRVRGEEGKGNAERKDKT